MALSEALDIFKAGVPDIEDEDIIEVDDAASIDDVFADSAFRLSHSRASTAMVVPREKPRRMAELFGEIVGEAAAIKGIAMPAPPPPHMSDDMHGGCFRTQSSPRRATQCPLFTPVQHFFTAAGGDPSTLKSPVKAFSNFTEVDGCADTPLEPPLEALLCLSVLLCLTICGGDQQPRPALLCPGLHAGWQGGLRPGGSRKMPGGLPLLQRHPPIADRR